MPGPPLSEEDALATPVALLPETVRRFSEYQDLAYGALLILILIYAPGGIASFSRLGSRKPNKGDA